MVVQSYTKLVTLPHHLVFVYTVILYGFDPMGFITIKPPLKGNMFFNFFQSLKK